MSDTNRSEHRTQEDTKAQRDTNGHTQRKAPLTQTEVESKVEKLREHMTVFRKKFLEMQKAKDSALKGIKKTESTLKDVSEDFTELAGLLDSTIGKIKDFKEDEKDKITEELEFISTQLRESGNKLLTTSQNKFENIMQGFDKSFGVCQESLDKFTENAKDLLNINNLKNFRRLGIAKFGKPERPREERACKNCFKNMSPYELPENFHTPLECPTRGYDRIIPPKKERAFVVIKDPVVPNSFYPVEVVCYKSRIYDKQLDVYNYFTLDNYTLESSIKYWKESGEWMSDDEYAQKQRILAPKLRRWTRELSKFYYKPYNGYRSYNYVY